MEDTRDKSAQVDAVNEGERTEGAGEGGEVHEPSSAPGVVASWVTTAALSRRERSRRVGRQ